MSAALDRIHQLLDEAKTALEHMFGHSESAAAQKIDEAKAAIEKEAPALLAEAGTDAADVVHTAETEGVAPAAAEAAKDAAALGEEAVHDAEAAVEPAPKSETPAEPSAPSASA